MASRFLSQRPWRNALAGAALLTASFSAWAAPVTLHVYGPGGPAPAMREAAQAFAAAHPDIQVDVVAGPTPQWLAQAKDNADLIFSGAENMMSAFAAQLPEQIDLKKAEPLYLRPVAILVRPGNPKNIQGFKDLLKPDMKVMAVAGAGQTGLWEDVAGRLGDIETVKAFRKNLVLPEAANSALAKQQWTEQKDIDAWLIWNIWQVANPDLAEQVAVEEPYRIYRDVGIVMTETSQAQQQTQAFIDFLKSKQGQKIFAKWGWDTPDQKH